jgi:integrase/recombinase XerD
MVSLDVADVDLTEYTVLCNKASPNRRVVPITPRTVEVIRNYLQRGRPEIPPALNEQALLLNPHGERLTRQGLWLVIKECVKTVGIRTPVTPHTLRHSFAVHLLHRGEEVARVQQLLGHISAATTQAYVRMLENAARVQSPAMVREE